MALRHTPVLLSRRELVLVLSAIGVPDPSTHLSEDIGEDKTPVRLTSQGSTAADLRAALRVQSAFEREKLIPLTRAGTAREEIMRLCNVLPPAALATLRKRGTDLKSWSDGDVSSWVRELGLPSGAGTVDQLWELGRSALAMREGGVEKTEDLDSEVIDITGECGAMLRRRMATAAATVVRMALLYGSG